MAEATADAERIVREYVELWNERAYDEIPNVVSDSFVMYDPAAPAELPGPDGEVHGREGLEEFIREVIAAFPDFRVTILDMVSDGDLVMYEGEVSMTHEGEFDGIPPTGRNATFREMATYRVADGTVREHRSYFDQQGIFEQLGLTEE